VRRAFRNERDRKPLVGLTTRRFPGVMYIGGGVLVLILIILLLVWLL
jgi:hypothetical protein